jgi:hypothetical protein
MILKMMLPFNLIDDFLPQEALDMVKPGMQMAEKMPDAYVQLWGASLLRGMTVY